MRHSARYDGGRGGDGGGGGGFRLATRLALGVLLAFVGQGGAGVAAAPASDSDCALLMPLTEIERGKGSFLSGCETLSATSYLGGCWTESDNEETKGCQTCYIEEDTFADAVFPVVFSEELDPCPASVNYATLYETEHGPLSIVTAASLTSAGCPEGWLYFKDTDHCYLKSSNTAKASDQGDAVSKCEAEGAWLIALETEAENSFLVNNMLWIGFFGETYTGLVKTAIGAEWGWPAEAAEGATTSYTCLSDFSDWLEGAALGCEADYNGGAEGSSCMEILPYEPKGWNPFSCQVGKHYVCEMPASGTATGPTTTTTSSSSSSLSPSTSPSLSPSGPPSSAPSSPSPSTAPTGAPGAGPTPHPSGAPVAPTPPPTEAISPTPAPASVTSEPSGAPDEPTGAPSVKGDGDRGLSPTPSPVGSTEPPSDTATEAWKGDKVFSVTKTGLWGSATYSLYLIEGDEETPVAEKVVKDGLGSEEDEYMVKLGCYRLQVTSPTATDPSALTWDVTGGSPFRTRDLMTGNGLDGALYTVGGGVCGIGACEASCLEDHFSSSSATEGGGSCDGYRALLAGECSDVCQEEGGEDAQGFQEMCVRAECEAETVCGVEEGKQSVGVDSYLEVEALLSGDAGSSSTGGGGVGDGQEEFEVAVASWLGVDPDIVSVTEMNGVDIDEEVASFRRRALLRGGGRLLQTTDSTSSSSQEYARYTCQVKSDDIDSDGVVGLQEKAVESGSGSALEALFANNGGVLSGVSVVGVEAEVMRDVYIVGSSVEVGDGDAQELDGDRAWYEDDPLATGGIAAGVVVMLGLLIFACCVCRHRAAGKTRRRSSAPAVRSLTQDFESGDERYVPSDLASQQYAANKKKNAGAGAYNKGLLPSKEECYHHADEDTTRLSAVAAAAAAAAAATGAEADADGAGGGTGGSDGVNGDAAGGGGGYGFSEDVSSSSARKGRRREAGTRERPPKPSQSRARRAKFATLAIDSTPQEAGESTPSLGSSGEDNSSGGSGELSGGGGGSGTGGKWSRGGSTYSDAASTAVPLDLAALSAQDSTVLTAPLHSAAMSAGKSASGKQLAHLRSPSVCSKLSVVSNQGPETSLSATKKPNVRGPSGALASLGLGRGHSIDSMDYDGDGTESAGTFDGSAAGWSEAGSRFRGGLTGSGNDDYEGYNGEKRRASITEERIRAVQLSDSALQAVTVAPHDMALPSPIPFSPGTDWELAQDLAPTPNQESKAGHGSWITSPAGKRVQPSGYSEGVSGGRTAPRGSHSGSSHNRGRHAGGGGGAGSQSPGGAYDSDAASRAPSHKTGATSSSSSRGGRSRRGGGTPKRSRSRGTAPSRRGSGGGGGDGGGGGMGRRAGKEEFGGGDADSDCESRAPGFTVTPPRQRGSASASDSLGNPFDAVDAAAGGWSDVSGRGGGGSSGAPAVRLPSVFDSDGESRFYGTLSAGMSSVEPEGGEGNNNGFYPRRSTGGDRGAAAARDTSSKPGFEVALPSGPVAGSSFLPRRASGRRAALADSASGSVNGGFPGPSPGNGNKGGGGGGGGGDSAAATDEWRGGWKNYSPSQILAANGFGTDVGGGAGRGQTRGSAGAAE